MTKKIPGLLFFLLMFVSAASAAEKSRIVLTDGTTLDGEIVKFSEGKYTVKSSSLGTLRIEDSKVRTISRGESAAPVSKAPANLDDATIQNEIQKIQPAITGNPDIMKTVAGLVSDPDFQALFKDPEILSAAKSFDIKTLMANPKFIQAVNNPAVKEISEKIKKP